LQLAICRFAEPPPGFQLQNCPPTQVHQFFMLLRRSTRGTRSPEQGYILITLILFVAVLAIAMTVTAPLLMFQLKRDREAELIHRGTQYTRAIQHYYKKMGSYPLSLEALENTNQVRFLRRRYKDPVTGKDFKLLHMQDVQSAGITGLAGATPAANMPGGAGANGVGGLNSPGGPNGSAFGGFGNQGAAGGINGGPGGLNAGGLTGSQILQQVQSGTAGASGTTGTNNQGVPTGPENETDQEGSASGTSNSSPGGTASTGPGAPGTGLNGASGSASNNQVFGGGPIMGVSSTSKDKTIRIYSKKERYYQWLFVYDPSLDQGGLITTPYQQLSVGSTGAIQGATPAGAQVPGTPGTGNSGFGAPGGAGGPFGGQPNQPVTQPNQPNQGITPNMPPEQ
jgi:type II secretory pathway pseudopilin PulG